MAQLAPVEAWLARLPMAQRISAHAATDARLAGWVLGLAVLVGVCVLVSASGGLAWLRGRLEADRPRPWLTSAAAAGLLGLAVCLANAATEAFTSWRIDRADGVPASFWASLAKSAAGAPANLCVAIVLATPLYALIRRTPRLWPWIIGPAALALILALLWMPWALASGPALPLAPPGLVRQSVAQLAAGSGLAAVPILGAPDPGFDADVMGVIGGAKIVLGPRLLAGPPAEARAYVGHLLSHYVHDDLLVVCLIYGLSVLLAGLAVQRIAAPLARRLGAPAARSAADPETMPAALILATLVLVGGALAANGYLRWANVRADAYSLDHARAPDAFATVIERFWDHDSVDPSPVETAVFYSHPPLRERLAHIVAWKAAHPAAGGSP